VADVPEPGTEYDVVCPHCKKPFTARVMTGGTARHHGFKCPHCRLFVPYQRADERDLVERSDR
jgi:transposase-like protein